MGERALRTFGWLLLIALILRAHAGVVAAEPEPAAKTVRLTVDYGDGVQKHFTGLVWKEGATVYDVLQSAAKHPRGIKVSHQGAGATTLITAIDDLKNEGRGRNWLFEVNDKLGEKSCALVELKPGDAVLWRFATYK
jgi:Domain of unknown function (DUF4430)